MGLFRRRYRVEVWMDDLWGAGVGGWVPTTVPVSRGAADIEAARLEEDGVLVRVVRVPRRARRKWIWNGDS